MRYIIGIIVLVFLFSLWLAVVLELANSVSKSITISKKSDKKNI